MKFTKLIIAFLSFSFFLTGRVRSQADLEISYENKTYWSRLIQGLPYLSKEEKDRVALTWGKDDEKESGTKYLLQYSNHISNYSYQPIPANEAEDGYSWRQGTFVIQRNFKEKTITEWIESLNKSFLIQDPLSKPKWKILNEIKEIAGYVCMKAEMIDTVRKIPIVAWFSDALPPNLGPDEFFGLPGTILEINKNNGCAIITATKINQSTFEHKLKIPKLKGKKLTREKYNHTLFLHINESIKAQKNPFWSIRY